MRIALSSLAAAMLLVHLNTASLAATGTLADLENAAPAPAPRVSSSPSLSAQDEQRLSTQLYDQLMQQAEQAEDPASINSLLGLADQLKFGKIPDDSITLERRAAHYQQRIQRTQAPSDEILYEYASTLDKLGKTTESAAIIQRILQQNPSSIYAAEGNFRIAEDAFINQRYREAITGYQAVLRNLEPSHRFWPQAQYQLAWAFYRSGRFEDAIAPFKRLIDHLEPKTERTKSEEVRLQDSYRTLSLVFTQLGGASALAKYYANQPLDAEQIRLYREVSQRYIEQKQPFDVAQTYEKFIQQHPLSTEAAEFNQALIQVYTDAGFAQDIIRAKHDYVKRFALDGEYMQQASAEQQARIRPLLKSHLDTLALHYHASAQNQAQINERRRDYQTAATLYQQQLALAANSADQVRILQAQADTLYRGEQYPEAIQVFEQLAYDQPRGTDPAESGYFALLSYQALLKNATNAQQAERLSAQKQATQRYASTFADKPQAAEAMLTVLAHYLEKEQLGTVVELAQQTLQLPNLNAEQRQSTQIVLANAYFDQQQWTEAEKNYRAVLALPNLKAEQVTRYQNQLAASLYKQADHAQQAGQLEAAAKLYQQASQASVEDRVKVDAAWRSAMVLGETADAIAPLQQFYRTHVGQPQAEGIPERIVAIQEKIEDWRAASQTYQLIVQRDQKTNPSNALAALWLAAESERKARLAQNPNQASSAEINLYQQYLSHPQADFAQSIEASERLYQAAVTRNDKPAQLAEQQRQQAFAKRPDRPAALKPRLDYMQSRALTEQAAAQINLYQAISIGLPLRDSIAKKQAALQTLLQQQQAIVDLNVAEFVTQAQFHIGNSFAGFYTGILNAPTPAGLSELEAEEYQIAIEEQTQPIKEQALTWHRANLGLLHDPEQPLWDQWVARSLDSLAELASGFYDRPIIKPTSFTETQVNTIWLSWQNKQYDAALKAADAMLSTSPSAAAHWLRGISLLKLGQFKEAQQALAQAQQLNMTAPEIPYVQGILQELYLNQAQPALAHYEQYIAFVPNDRTVQRWINVLQRQLKMPLTRFNAPAAAVVAAAEPETDVTTPVSDTDPAAAPSDAQDAP
ncbi:MAG: tetratricopeptide repeat protein [Pseudomonadota bacterium]|nr:tetratricopeptide repeat protein [Pseudomonadota bacterium]